MRIIWYSGDAGVIRSSRSTSRSATASTARAASPPRRACAAPGSRCLAFAELVLDRLQLLAQEVLPLRVGHLLLARRLDLALQLEQRDLARQRHRDRLQLDERRCSPRAAAACPRPSCRAGWRAGRRAAADRRGSTTSALRSGERPVASDSARSTSSCSRRTWASISSERSADSGSGVICACIRPPSVCQLLGARASDALDEHAHAVRRLRHLADDRDRADPVQIVGRRLVGLGLLQQQQHHAIAGERAVDRFDRHRRGSRRAARPSTAARPRHGAERREGRQGSAEACQAFSIAV